MILAALNVAMILTIWFNTHAFEEYADLIKLGKVFSWYSEYQLIRSESPGYSFNQYLLEHRNNFFTRLITCPVCTSMWLGIFSIVLIPMSQALPVSFLGLFLFRLMAILLKHD